jgi:hypothetical protein
MTAEAVTEPLATEVAVMVTFGSVGTDAGEVYVTATPEALDAGETLPQVAPLQPAPDSVQFTPWFCESFCSVAVNICVAPPDATLAVAGDTVTTIGGGATVMVALADFVLSAMEVAVRLTVPAGADAGAV